MAIKVFPQAGVFDNPTGKLWQSVNLSPSTASLICFGNGMFLLSPFAGGIGLKSTDGVTWDSVMFPSSPSGNWSSLTFGNGIFLFSNNATSGQSPYTAVSADGENWTVSEPVSSYTTYLYRPRWLNDRFYATWGSSNASYATSFNGLEWTLITGTQVRSQMSFAYGNGIYLGCANNAVTGNGRIIMSVDGSNWTVLTDDENYVWTDIIFMQDKFVMVGYDPKTSPRQNLTVVTSNGTDWEYGLIPLLPAGTAYASMIYNYLTYGNGMLCAATQTASSSSGTNGGGRIASSSNGLDWTLYTWTGANTADSVIDSGTFGNGRFAFAGRRSAGTSITRISPPANIEI